MAPAREVPRGIREGARDLARTEAWRATRRQRKKVEMSFAYLARILCLDGLRLSGPTGTRDEVLRASIARNLRKPAKLIAGPAPVAAT